MSAKKKATKVERDPAQGAALKFVHGLLGLACDITEGRVHVAFGGRALQQQFRCESCDSGVVLAQSILSYDGGSTITARIVSGSTSYTRDRAYLHCRACADRMAAMPDDE